MNLAAPRPQLGNTLTPAVLSRVAAAPVVPPYWQAGALEWNALDDLSVTTLTADAGAALTMDWPDLTDAAWAEFHRSGDRVAYEAPYFARRRALTALALAHGAQPDARYEAAMTDALTSILAEKTWCVPAHDTPPGGTLRRWPDPDAPVLDLFASETGALCAWIAHVHGSWLPPALITSLWTQVEARVLAPFEDDAPRYHWFGLPANWNTWVVGNTLACILLAPMEAGRRHSLLTRAVASLDGYLAGVPTDGGCPEGIMYWWQSGARLFEALELLAANAPAAIAPVLADPLLRGIARYPLVVDQGHPWNAVFGDGSPRIPPRKPGVVKDEHPPALLSRFARAVNDPDLAALAAHLRVGQPRLRLHCSMQRALAALATPPGTGVAEPQVALTTVAAPASASADSPTTWGQHATYWLPDTQVLSASALPHATALRLVAKAGHNGEPHNHLDVGTFTLSLPSDPVVIDIGSGRYTAMSFTARRYEQWFTRSQFHNVPDLGGGQVPGPRGAAWNVTARPTAEHWSLSCDLAGAYDMPGLTSWLRRFEPDGHGGIDIDDAWCWEGSARAFCCTVMTAREPVVIDDHTLVLSGAGVGGRVRLTIEPPSAVREVERITLDDDFLAAAWGPAVWRIAYAQHVSRGNGHIRTHFGSLCDR